MILFSFGFLLIIITIFGSGYIMCSNRSFIKKTIIMCLIFNISLTSAIILSSIISIEVALSISILLVPIMLFVTWWCIKEIKEYVRRN
jgi:hypothetical protein